LADGVKGTTEFKGPNALEILALEKELGTGDLIRLAGSHYWCADRVVLQDFGRFGNIGGGDAVGRNGHDYLMWLALIRSVY
jgi:hypothetical protein